MACGFERDHRRVAELRSNPLSADVLPLQLLRNRKRGGGSERCEAARADNNTSGIRLIAAIELHSMSGPPGSEFIQLLMHDVYHKGQSPWSQSIGNEKS